MTGRDVSKRPESAATSGLSATRLHVFRVEEGLGNACLLIFPDDTCAILDWGTKNQTALDKALDLASESGRFRFIAATHVHRDHTLGLAAMLASCHERGIRVDRFVYPATSLPVGKATSFKDALVACEKYDFPPWEISVDTFAGPHGVPEPPYLAWGRDPDWEVRLLAPVTTTTTRSESKAVLRGVVTGNETSFVVLFRFSSDDADLSQGRLLLPGDATRATLGAARRLAAHFPQLSLDNQAIVVPHHGSQHNLPRWLYDHIRGLAVISAETDSEHHPHRQVLKKLSRLARPDGQPHLFCTSYAGWCARDFAGKAADESLVRPGSCFGHVVVAVPRQGPARVLQTSVDGSRRRPYGHCGHPAVISSRRRDLPEGTGEP